MRTNAMSAYSCRDFKPTLGQISRVDLITYNFTVHSPDITGVKTHHVHKYNRFSYVVRAHLCLLIIYVCSLYIKFAS